MSRQFNRERRVVSTKGSRTTDIHMQKNEVGLLPHNIHKWTIALNARSKTVKLLEENIQVNLHDLGLGSDDERKYTEFGLP